MASEPEVEFFREGIVKMLSNLLIYEVSKQYKADPARFEGARNIHVADPKVDHKEDQFERSAQKHEEAQTKAIQDRDLPFF